MRTLTIVVLGTYVAALIAFFAHDLVVSPQPDAELLIYAHQLYKTIGTDWFDDFYFVERKYPFLFLFLVSFLLRFTLWVFDASVPLWSSGMTQLEVGTVWTMVIYGTGRLAIVLCALGTLWLLRRMSRKLFGNSAAVLLLLSSPLFFVFSTAVRPHVAVAFWTLLSLFFAIKLHERKTWWVGAGAFGAALLAFCTLQNGIFAFIFPLWGLLFPRPTWRRTVIGICATVACLGAAVFLGYPFLMKGATTGIELGHKIETHWNGAGFRHLSNSVFGGELFLWLFAAISMILFARRRVPFHAVILPILIFIGSYIALFGMHGSTLIRYWIIFLPLLALLGAPAYKRMPAMARAAFLIMILLMYAKFTVLALKENTYQAVLQAVAHRAEPITVLLPQYAHTELPSRITEPENASIAVANAVEEQLASWNVCSRIVASPITDQNMFLWVDVPWAYYHLLFTKRLGPNLAVYCREGTEL